LAINAPLNEGYHRDGIFLKKLDGYIQKNVKIPPTEVTGSFLTGVMLEYDGSPVADAKLTIEDTRYETKTSLLGEFALPVIKITAKTIPLKVNSKDKIVLADFEIPQELVKPVSQARINLPCRLCRCSPQRNPSARQRQCLKWHRKLVARYKQRLLRDEVSGEEQQLIHICHEYCGRASLGFYSSRD
jgi:hypothetical protein